MYVVYDDVYNFMSIIILHFSDKFLEVGPEKFQRLI